MDLKMNIWVEHCHFVDTFLALSFKTQGIKLDVMYSPWCSFSSPIQMNGLDQLPFYHISLNTARVSN